MTIIGVRPPCAMCGRPYFLFQIYSFSSKHSATKVQSCAPSSIVRCTFHNSLVTWRYWECRVTCWRWWGRGGRGWRPPAGRTERRSAAPPPCRGRAHRNPPKVAFKVSNETEMDWIISYDHYHRGEHHQPPPEAVREAPASSGLLLREVDQTETGEIYVKQW